MVRAACTQKYLRCRPQQSDDWWDKYFARKLGSERCLRLVCEIVERCPKRWHILGWAQAVVFKPFRALSMAARPVPFRGAALSANTLHLPANNLHINPWTSRTFPISLSARQQLPSNARPDNRFTLPASSLSTLGLSNYCQHKQRGRESKNEKRDGWMWTAEEWREQSGTWHTHTHTVWHIYHSSSDAGTRALPSMSLPLSFPSFFQVIPLVTSVLLISPYFSSPHSSLGLTATHVPSQSPSLKAHIALIKKKGERDEEGKSNRQKNEMTFWALT